MDAYAIESNEKTFFAGDYEKKIAGLWRTDSRGGGFIWKIAINNIHDAQSLPDDHWLIQTDFSNVIELDASGKEVWRYESNLSKQQPVEIHAFRRLPNGNTMIAESGPGRIIEVNRNLEVVREIKLKLQNPDPHRDTRLVRPTPTGSFLVAHEGDKMIREYAPSGEVVWEYPINTQVYSAERLANGNTLIGTGSGHSVVEVTPEGTVAWQVGENDLNGAKLAWVTMVHRLPNGNTWIVNCHAGREQPQIIEINSEKAIVFKFNDFETFGNALPVAVIKDK
jgi:hypothetical protein